MRTTVFFLFFKILLTFFFLERGKEGEREGERGHCVVASYAAPNQAPGLQPRHVP